MSGTGGASTHFTPPESSVYKNDASAPEPTPIGGPNYPSAAAPREITFSEMTAPQHSALLMLIHGYFRWMYAEGPSGDDAKPDGCVEKNSRWKGVRAVQALEEIFPELKESGNNCNGSVGLMVNLLDFLGRSNQLWNAPMATGIGTAQTLPNTKRTEPPPIPKVKLPQNANGGTPASTSGNTRRVPEAHPKQSAISTLAKAAIATSKVVVNRQKVKKEEEVKPPMNRRGRKKSASKESWDELFNQLVHFNKGYGHCRVPTAYKANRALARWVVQIRASYKKYQSSVGGRKDGGESNKEPSSTQGGEELEAGTNAEGQAEAEAETGTSDENQPSHTTYSPHYDCLTLNEDRIKRMNELGFVWSMARPTVPWEQRYNELIEFKREFGHTRVPRSFRPNPKLGDWCHFQRVIFKGQGHTLKNKAVLVERVRKLEEIGFAWSAETGTPKLSWDERFEQLVEFRRRNGHCNVPSFREFGKDGKAVQGDDDKDDLSTATHALALWVHRQRPEYAKFRHGLKSCLDKSRVRKLEGIGFEWGDNWKSKTLTPPSMEPKKERRKYTWEERYAQLVEYKARFGNTRVPQYWPEDPKLNHWVNEQRKNYRFRKEGKRNNMSDERLERLEALGFEFSILKRRSKKRPADEPEQQHTNKTIRVGEAFNAVGAGMVHATEEDDPLELAADEAAEEIDEEFRDHRQYNVFAPQAPTIGHSGAATEENEGLGRVARGLMNVVTAKRSVSDNSELNFM